VPDFTFFATAEAPAFLGATPIFVDVNEDTFNMCPDSLEKAIKTVIQENKLNPKVVIPVDLFGLPADYDRIIPIAENYNLLVLEDAAQGFGGSIRGRNAGSFGDAAITSFFPAKPLGCYGDGGAIFTNDSKLNDLLNSLKVHGKAKDKYDNVRIGMNSRLDTLQAAILLEKFRFFNYELNSINKIARFYDENLFNDKFVKPFIPNDYCSSFAQYTLKFKDKETCDNVMEAFKVKGIPYNIYYPRYLSQQEAFIDSQYVFSKNEKLFNKVTSIPIHPYMKKRELRFIVNTLNSI
jgi:dTDP-4-amino-4,6-dideoxygalactose transaminase